MGAVPDPVAAPSTLDSGDIAWVLMSTALVLLMTIPGACFGEAGVSESCGSAQAVTWVSWRYIRVSPQGRETQYASSCFWGLLRAGISSRDLWEGMTLRLFCSCKVRQWDVSNRIALGISYLRRMLAVLRRYVSGNNLGAT